MGSWFSNMSIRRSRAVTVDAVAQVLVRMMGERGYEAAESAEEADGLFVAGKIGFTDITDVIGMAMESVPFAGITGLEDVLAADRAARETVLAASAKL